MLSAIRRSSSLSASPPPYRVSAQRSIVKLDRKYHAKVSALPFALTKDEAIRHVAPWAAMAKMGKGLVKSLLAKYLPNSRSEPLQPDDLKAVYIPVWFVDGEVTGNITKSGHELPAMIHSLNSYMPGFSFDPLSTLSFSQLRLEELVVPFTPELRHQHGLDISCLPFSMSPVPLLNVLKSLTPSQCKLPEAVTFDAKSLDFPMFAAYPVMLPIYLMRYDWPTPGIPDAIEFTCMVQGHSTNGLTYIDCWAPDISDLIRETISVKPNSLLFKITRSVGDLPLWEAHGTSYGFSSLGIPIARPVFDTFNRAVSAWVDKIILSKSDMGTLAEHGVDMNHPCVRVYNKEEVDANRRFLAASANCFKISQIAKKASVENIRSGKMKVYSLGNSPGNPEAAIEALKKQVVVVEKEKEDLKPQWLREWQDSQRPPAQSAPS